MSADLASPAVVPSYLDMYRADAIERIAQIRAGVRAEDARRIFADLALAQDTALSVVKLSAATIDRKAVRDEALSLDESERVLGVARLIGQVQAMMEDSGDAAPFDAARWMSSWLAAPLPALAGRRPLDFLDTMEGQALVSDLLARMRSGAYS